MRYVRRGAQAAGGVSKENIAKKNAEVERCTPVRLPVGAPLNFKETPDVGDQTENKAI